MRITFAAIGLSTLFFAAGVQAHPQPSEAGVESDAPIALDGECGDGRCQAPEDCNSCSQDCGSCCGDHRCQPPEDARSCPGDCSR